MTVTGCDECPLFEAGEDAERCRHPGAPEPAIVACTAGEIRGGIFVPASWPAPDWCPLREAPLTIALVRDRPTGDLSQAPMCDCEDCNFQWGKPMRVCDVCHGVRAD